MTSPLRTMIRDLHRRRGRERRGLALAEGVRLVEEALAAALPLRGAAISPALEATTRGRALKSALEQQAVRLEAVSETELADLADTEHPQGVVAVVEPRRWALEDIAVAPGRPALVLDGVQDPGNVGAIIRAAEACGATAVIAGAGTADPFGWKALRGSMGSAFRLRVALSRDLDQGLTAARASGLRIFATIPRGGTPLAKARLAGPSAVLLGGEGAGLGEDLITRADEALTIPMQPPVESLNVAIAAALVLYEASRQRLDVTL